ncbi:MAG: bifunctional proline dehydrogenase/L-glutamate gamma-semialdehyde dehydrogenase PutA, partial [Burkholderiales bacterium]
PIEKVIADPVEALRGREPSPHPAIPLPRNLYGADRRNSPGLNLTNPDTLAALAKAMKQRSEWQAAPLIAGKAWRGEERALFDPADRTRRLGSVIEASEEALETALAVAHAAFGEWDATPAQGRARVLERAAELFEQRRAELTALIVREGGRTIPDALAEIREATDYCRYYAAETRRLFSAPNSLPGPSGEDNTLGLHGRGVFAALSPWNFPLAIFTGQITAALAAGNSVIAKPAEQTPLVAMRAVELLHEAGIPAEVLNFVPGAGDSIGAKLVADSRISGVVFTGSTETALAINRALAAREGPIAPLIAETGGMNAIVADSSALAEQLVADVIQSAFNSAGQRCSAARLLFVQEDIADQVIELLAGAIDELKLGDPSLLSTDVGPLIDEKARKALQKYCESQRAPLLATAPLSSGSERGVFFVPRMYEISIEHIPQREVFGPILHVIRWKANELDSVIAAINNAGYGLTLGIHSRIEETIDEIRARVHAGNVYVNRNIIGAVVGVQPFGGEGLSGTGPKAGGPNYLVRFALEKSVSVNTAAIGGNASLLALDDDKSE